jgi:outer membrane protein assembly factor BamB
VSFPAGGGQLYCLNDSGQKLWSYNTAGSGISGWQCASAAVGDVDADDTLEVIGAANYWGVFCLDHRGQEVWARRVSEHAASYPAIADVDGDDTLDVVVALGPTMRCLNGRTGRDQWQYTVASGYYIVSSPGIADLDGDGLLETVFAEVKQNNPNDSLRPMWLLNSGGQALWNDTVGTTMSDATLGDVDRDGRVEFCIGPTYRWSQWWLYRADTTAVEPGRVDWPTLQHDIWRTGLYGYEGPSTGLSERRAALPVRARLRARPNPARGRVLLSLAGQRGGALSVFDASGRLVRALELDGRGTVLWTGTDEHGRLCPPGVYVCRVSGSEASVGVVLTE